MQTLAYSTEPARGIRYWQAYRFLFTGPNAWMNLLLGSVCILIPAIGQIVLIGYLIEALTAPKLDDQSPPPDFDFGRFVDYLTRGIWPFVASLFVTLAVLLPFYLIVALAIFGIQATHLKGAGLAAAVILLALIFMVVWIACLLVMEPLLIRAALLEQFHGIFSLAWVKDFIARMWPQMLVCWLFLMATALPLVLLGYAMCFVGVYPAIVLLTGAQWHLNFQMYELYLSRGGRPVPTKPKPAPLPPLQPPPIPGAGPSV